MPQGKQAKILSKREERSVLDLISHGRYPIRDRALFLLSVKAGLRAKEIGALTWPMVGDASGQVGESIELTDVASKGKGGRSIPMNKELREALEKLATLLHDNRGPVIQSERGGPIKPGGICDWFGRLYARARLGDCSSHSGRRTFITRTARKITEVGGSLRDIQQLAGHSNLTTTQRYIEGSSDAKKKVVEVA